MGDDSTRERAFVAALYLRDRLSQEERNLWTWCTISPTKRLETIAKEISSAEPLLRCFDSDALIQHYQQVITLYRAMEKELPGVCPRRHQSHFLKIARTLSIIETNTGLLQLSAKTTQRKEKKVTDKEFERILQVRANSMNNKAEGLVDGVNDQHQALLTMTEAKEVRNDEQMKEKKGTDKASKWILDPQMKTFHEMAVMADRQRNDRHQALPTMVRAKEKNSAEPRKEEKHAQPWKGKIKKWNERTDKVLQRILEIHMNTMNNKVEWPIDCHQALPAVPPPWDSEDGLSITAIGKFEHQGEFRMTQAVENDEEDKEDKEGEILTTTVQPAPTGDRMQSSHPVPGPNQHPGMEFFVDIFKDPPNVDELLASVRPPPTSFEG